MAKNPVLPLYYNDLNGSTQDWTDEEFGAYIRLLIYQWDKGFIPSDMKRLLKIADSAEKNWPVLCQKFTPDEKGFLKNSVMEKIRDIRARHVEKQKENISKRYQTYTKVSTKNLPLENEDEKEKELELEIVLPFTSEKFQVSWQKWKDYRKKELRKTYKSNQSEQAALSHLENLSDKNESVALLIINRSIANQWQGLFELENKKNGTGAKSTVKDRQLTALKGIIETGKAQFAALRKEGTGT